VLKLALVPLLNGQCLRWKRIRLRSRSCVCIWVKSVKEGCGLRVSYLTTLASTLHIHHRRIGCYVLPIILSVITRECNSRMRIKITNFVPMASSIHNRFVTDLGRVVRFREQAATNVAEISKELRMLNECTKARLAASTSLILRNRTYASTYRSDLSWLSGLSSEIPNVIPRVPRNEDNSQAAATVLMTMTKMWPELPRTRGEP